jgi:C_GCAxxG_C_C family probable redox protein
MSKREEQAVQNFLDGCNCAQSVLLAYADVLGLTREQAAMVSVGFGGGMGRLRLHCGAFSAAVMLAGVLEGEDGDKKEHRPQTYARVQEIHRRFVERNGTVSCAELLGRAGVPEDPTPEERTPEYYAKRPCARVIASTCQLIDEMLEENTHA